MMVMCRSERELKVQLPSVITPTHRRAHCRYASIFKCITNARRGRERHRQFGRGMVTEHWWHRAGAQDQAASRVRSQIRFEPKRGIQSMCGSIEHLLIDQIVVHRAPINCAPNRNGPNHGKRPIRHTHTRPAPKW